MQDLWNFALALYARPAVEQACLQLQEAGNDVCLLLTGAWLQQRGVACDANRLTALRELAEPWQRDVVTPLRQVRRDWRAAAAQDAELEALRAQVKTLELGAERVLLQRLQGLADNWPGESGEHDWLTHLARGNSAALELLRGASRLT